jgi:primosomal protein N' (replication factor Y)
MSIPAKPGDAVFVPLGSRSALGFVVRVYDVTEEELGFPFSALKGALSRLEGFGLPQPVIELAQFVADEYLCPLPVALSAAAPPGIIDRLVTSWTLTGVMAEHLTPMQSEVLRTLHDAGGSIMEAKGKPISEPIRRALRLLRAKGLVEQTLSIAPLTERRKTEALLSLTAETDRVEGFLKKEGRKKPAQALTLMRLQAAERSILTVAEIKAMSGVTETTVKALLDAGLLETVFGDPGVQRIPPTPNRYQQLAIDAVQESIASHESRTFLLYGVTGSGKTEVYLHCASEALRQGRQVLYMVPEIALATQAITQLRERFGRGVAVLHSELSASERIDAYLRIRRGECPVVLGARSAVFAGLENIGLIVIDEEHEASYKQETAPRYHTKRLAQFLSERHRCPLLLGSATPSIESFHEAETERITLLGLPQRTASAKLPTVHVLDLKDGYRSGQPTIFSEELFGRLQETLGRDEQAILFLNRRAYAPFLLCRDCGRETKCPNCAVSLSFHRLDKRLRCHHCGFSMRPPDVCPNCGGARVRAFGVGTEKVEEAVGELLPDAKIARLDRDVAAKKGALESVLADFRSGQTQILVGTQMVAKGLDFPNVTLVGVIAADVSLNIPDFRSAERTFQLLAQVAGRAGRGQKPGEVVIQTFQPDHIAILTAQTHDYLALYEHQKAERRAAGYPPYKRLVNIVFTGDRQDQVAAAAADAAALLAGVDGELLGPVECALERIQNRWRYHVLLKLSPYASAAPVQAALSGFKPLRVQVTVDVDPYSLM